MAFFGFLTSGRSARSTATVGAEVGTNILQDYVPTAPSTLPTCGAFEHASIRDKLTVLEVVFPRLFLGLLSVSLVLHKLVLPSMAP